MTRHDKWVALWNNKYDTEWGTCWICNQTTKSVMTLLIDFSEIKICKECWRAR